MWCLNMQMTRFLIKYAYISTAKKRFKFLFNLLESQVFTEGILDISIYRKSENTFNIQK